MYLSLLATYCDENPGVTVCGCNQTDCHVRPRPYFPSVVTDNTNNYTANTRTNPNEDVDHTYSPKSNDLSLPKSQQ